MADDTLILLAFLSLCATVALSVLLKRWRNSKGRASIHAADMSTDDIALSALSTIGDTTTTLSFDGTAVMRPPFGMRTLLPALAAGLLIWTDFAPLLFEVLEVTNATVQNWIVAGLLLMLGLATLQLNFFQQVTYTHSEITCTGVQLRPQRRDLFDLIDIRVHPKRPALVLTFADQKRLYIPKFLTGRDAFVAFMEQRVAANLARGMDTPKEGLAGKLGF